MKKWLILAVPMLLGLSDSEAKILHKTLVVMSKDLVNNGYVHGWCSSDPEWEGVQFMESFQITSHTGCVVNLSRYLISRPFQCDQHECKRTFRQERAEYTVNLAFLKPILRTVERASHETENMPVMDPARLTCDTSKQRALDPTTRNLLPYYRKKALVYAADSLPGKKAFFGEGPDGKIRNWSEETLFITTDNQLFRAAKLAWEDMIRMCQKP